MSMHVDGDFYNDASDVEDLISRLASLKEKVEAIADTEPIDEAVDMLYEILENAG